MVGVLRLLYLMAAFAVYTASAVTNKNLTNTNLTNANLPEFDEHWKHRQKEAIKNANEAYHPNPEQVTNEINTKVQRTLIDLGYNNETAFGNSTSRRGLSGIKAKFKGPCRAINPIDRCWRCKANWAQNRFRLADCALGFARGTTGGKGGRIYVVRDCTDDDVANPRPGTLRHAVVQKGPVWIIFGKSMVITLKQELIMTSDTTIDGRGANVHISYGSGITIQFIKNVIIHNIHIHDIIATSGGIIRDASDHLGLRTASDGDGITIFGSTKIWCDHLSMYNCKDGIIDVVQASTGVTISNCHFTKHNEVMLFGASDSYSEDKKMQITVAFTHFGKGLVQRMPRCRFGFIHVVNNDYTHWLMYAIGGSSAPTIISQGNRYIAPVNLACKQVTNRNYATPAQWASWPWRSEGDIMVNGAYFIQSGDPKITQKSSKKFNLMGPHAGKLVGELCTYSGTLRCTPGNPC